MNRRALILFAILFVWTGAICEAQESDRPIPNIGSDPQRHSANGAQGTKNQNTPPQKSVTVLNQINTLQTEKETTDVSEKKNEETKINRRLMFFTGLLFAVGALQLGTLVWQIFAYQTAERAWVLVSIHQPVKTEEGVYVIPIIKNHGKTTARITKFALSWCAVKSPTDLPPKPDYGRENAADFVVPPNAPLQPMSVLIPEKDYRDAEEIRIALYVYGFIDYMVWWRKRKTRFCFMHYPGPSTQPLPPGFYVGIQAPAAYTKTT